MKENIEKEELIEESKREIKNLHQRISALEQDLDYQVDQNITNETLVEAIKEMQYEFTKQGMSFVNDLNIKR